MIKYNCRVCSATAYISWRDWFKGKRPDMFGWVPHTFRGWICPKFKLVAHQDHILEAYKSY